MVTGMLLMKMTVTGGKTEGMNPLFFTSWDFIICEMFVSPQRMQQELNKHRAFRKASGVMSISGYGIRAEMR